MSEYGAESLSRVPTYCTQDGCNWSFAGSRTRTDEYLKKHLRVIHGIELAAVRPVNGSATARLVAKNEKVRATGGTARKWTEDAIVDAIRAWVAQHGKPPTADGWAKADPSGRRPTTSLVAVRFGKWSAALEAAGVGKAALAEPGDETEAGRTERARLRGGTASSERVAEPDPGSASADRITVVMQLVERELRRAVERFPLPFHSPHEGWAVVQEETRELMIEVFENRGRQASAIEEAVQVAAMGARYVLDLGGDR